MINLTGGEMMFMTFNEEDNFCRVFEMPELYPTEFCFGGGWDVMFKMVDWFNPIPSQIACSFDPELKEMFNEENEIDTDKLDEMLVVFLSSKNYIQPGRKYLVVMDFGHCFYFGPVKKNCR